MHTQVNTDRNIDATESLVAEVKREVNEALRRHRDRITRVEVHMSDQNGDKGGADDKRCVMEARVEGLSPMAVSHNAATLDDAVTGAAEKLARSVESTLARRQERG